MKILVIRFSSIGDIVLTSPIIRCLKQKYPQAEIHFLLNETFAELVENNPYINKVWYWNHKEHIRLFRNKLKQENFDLVIDLHNNFRSRILSIGIAKQKYHLQHIRWKRFLYIYYNKLHFTNEHIVERYFKTLSSLNILYDGLGLEFWFSPSLLKIANIPQQFVAWVIGGSYYTKQVPAHKIIEGLALLPFPVVLLGGKKDDDLAQEIITKSGHKNLANCVGKLTIQESAKIIQQSVCVISTDTGLQHIAAALKKKIFSIWGSTSPGLQMGPFLPNNILEINTPIHFEVDLDCRPCHKHGYASCPKKHFSCMENQNMSTIIQNVVAYYTYKIKENSN